MSDRSVWKMLHLLYNVPSGQNGVSFDDLNAAGVTCGPDTIDPLTDSGAARREGDRIILNPSAKTILSKCVVSNRRWAGKDMLVDYPQAFVIMPFSEDWSDEVEQGLIEPAITGAGLVYQRGDTSPRVAELALDIWNELLLAGVVVADVSALNANVFYELGLAHALGKDVFIIKQTGAKVPADFGGAHYYEYDRADLPTGRDKLMQALKKFVADNHFDVVRKIRGV